MAQNEAADTQVRQGIGDEAQDDFQHFKHFFQREVAPALMRRQPLALH